MSAATDHIDAILHLYSGEEKGVRVVRCRADDLRRDLVRFVTDIERSLRDAEEMAETWKRIYANSQPRTFWQRIFR